MSLDPIKVPKLASTAAQRTLEAFSKEHFCAKGRDGREYLNITKLIEYVRAADGAFDPEFRKEISERMGRIILDYLIKHTDELNNPEIVSFHKTCHKFVALPNREVSLGMAKYLGKHYPDQIVYIKIATLSELSEFLKMPQPLECWLGIKIDSILPISTEQFADILKLCPQLTTLNLSFCGRIKNEALAHLEKSTQLRNLDLLGWNHLNSDGLAHLAKLTQLRDLILMECHQLTDADLLPLTTLTELKDLNLSGCERITNEGLALLTRLTRLTKLNLTRCRQITDDGLSSLARLAQLIKLSLVGCRQITNVGIAHFATLTQLRTLDLLGTQVTDAGANSLKRNNPLLEVKLVL